MHIGEAIRQTREARGLTLRQLAGVAGIKGTHIARIERGELDPRASTLRKLAAALSVDLARLLVNRNRPGLS